MGRPSYIVERVNEKSGVQALAEAVFQQAFRDLNSRRTATRDSAKAFLLAEDEGWRTARNFWAHLAGLNPKELEEEVQRQAAD